MIEEKWVMISRDNNVIEKAIVFDDYWSGARYTEHYIENVDDSRFGSIVIGECYNNNGKIIGLYRAESV